eukprot:6602860-Prymnesium_polylepis.1
MRREAKLKVREQLRLRSCRKICVLRGTRCGVGRIVAAPCHALDQGGMPATLTAMYDLAMSSFDW